jgi:ribosome recycling factor
MPAEVKHKATERMDAAMDHLKRELSGLRTGRASTGLLDSVRVDYYGTQTPLKQVANIAVPESRLITVQPWEPQLIKEIEKAITAAGLGLNPANDGKIIRLPVPPLTEERRKDLTKVCKKHGEETKITLRTIRRETNDELKRLQKESKLTEDDLRKAETDVQKLTDQYVQKVEQIIKKKEEEILEI